MALGITRIGLSTAPESNYFWGGEVHTSEDLISFADTSLAVLISRAEILDSFTLNDITNSITIFYASASDNVLFSDYSNVSATFSGPVVENLLITDTSSAVQTFVINIADSVVLTDSISVVKSFYSEAIDVIGFTDNARFVNRIDYLTFNKLNVNQPSAIVDIDFTKVNIDITLSTPKANTDLDNVNATMDN